MKIFVVTITLNKPFHELSHLLAAEGKRVEELAAAGLVKELLVRADLTGAWLILRAESEQVARAAVESLPMYPHMRVEIAETQPPRGAAH